MRSAAGAVALCLAGGLLMVVSSPALAAESVFWQGIAGSPFHLASPISSNVTVSGGADQSVSLTVGSATIDAAGYVSLGVSQPDPQSVEALSNGDVLVADPANRLVAEFSPSGSLVWSYTAADDSALRTPVCAGRLADGSTLICDSGAARVFIVNESHVKVWQYGQTGAAGSGVGLLDAPTWAGVLPNGNVAICDAGNHRVIEVRAGDYAAGYSAASIVWQYGQTGVAGDGAGQLETPSSVQILTAGVSRGNLLICDQGGGVAGAARVLEVDTAKSVVWRFPAAGTSSSAAPLDAPSCAMGSFGADNQVWIADPGRGSVLGVATNSISGRPTGHVVFADYGPSGGTPFSGSLSAPTSLSQAGDGSLVVGDPGGRRVVTLAATALLATVHSVGLDLGVAGRKRFASIRCTFASVPTADLTVSYSIDGGAPKLLGLFGGGSTVASGSAVKTIPLPPLTVGKRIAYWVTLSTGSAACAPELESLAIAFAPWTAPSSGRGGGGASGDRANSNGSASDSSSSAGGGSGSGGGVGGGSGSGSGQGAGSGRGSGSSGSSAGSDTGAAGTSAAGATVPPAVSGSGSAGDAARSVSGYAFRASGTAGGGEGGGVTPASAGLPLGSVSAGVAGVTFLLLVAPWAARRRLRLFVNWDPEAPRPFPAARTRDMPQRGLSAPAPFGFARFRAVGRRGGHRHR